MIGITPIGNDNMNRFEFEGKFTTGNVNSWVLKFINGKLERELYSENLPKEIFRQGDVMRLVGKNFFQKVEHNHQHSLIKFYAPWCPHCNDVSSYIVLRVLT